MRGQQLSIAHLEYLQGRPFILDTQLTQLPLTSAPPALRRLDHIQGVGRSEKWSKPTVGQLTRLLDEELPIGLYKDKVPLAFLVSNGPGGIAIHLGVWSPQHENTSTGVLEVRQNLVRSILASQYADVNHTLGDVNVRRLPLGGFALGTPTMKVVEPQEGALPIDRLIRGLPDAHWAYLVLAEPVSEQSISEVQLMVLNELQRVQAIELEMQVPDSLARLYAQQLQVLLKTLTTGQAVGAWQTTVYLLGDTTSYYALAALWPSIFSGEQSVPEPVRVYDNLNIPELATHWASPITPGMASPGLYRRPEKYRTLLTSTELAAYIHLPRLETSGFAIRRLPTYDPIPAPVVNDHPVQQGNVIQGTKITFVPYAVGLRSLMRHACIFGVPGSGKTNSVVGLLKELGALGVPFLVIEPAKREYRALLNHQGLGTRVQIFTLGDETVSPLRINPFEVLKGASVGVHIDLLKALFNISFGMWQPLPQVLERCLHEVYLDKGWDITANTNHRFPHGTIGSASFPTLADFFTKVDEVTATLGHSAEIKANIRGALLARLQSLRVGGKGRMLDVQRSLPIDVLLEHPTIIELEGVGDDDDKAFLMGLLFIRLIEARRAMGPSADLRHVLIIEEAHRLLAKTGPRGHSDEADPRGKLIETFANLLAECRASGQGIVIVDQSPSKLAPEVIKLTTLKQAHRIVDAEDRAALAGSMVMTELQAAGLATLSVGQAVVFTEGEDAPVLIQVKPHVDQQTVPDDATVASHMVTSDVLRPHRSIFLPYPTCQGRCVTPRAQCDTARSLSGDADIRRVFARLVLSTIEDTDALDRRWPDLLAVVNAKRAPRSNLVQLLRCLVVHSAYWFTGRRGSQADWSYADTAGLAERVCRMLLAKVDGTSAEPSRTDFQQYARQLHARHYDPFPACNRICQQQPPVCLYRHAAADLIAAGSVAELWRDADAKDQGKSRYETWDVCIKAADILIEDADPGLTQEHREAADRTALCFGQQLFLLDSTKLPREKHIVMNNLLEEADNG